MLKAAATELGQAAEQLWTGYVDGGAYRTWLAAADVAVQLRTDSRGETSGAILDCMGAGLATVVNDHGSAAELPADAVVRLPSGFTDAMLVEVLLLLRDPGQRQRLATKAREHVVNVLSPRRIAAEYHAVIEAVYANGYAAARQRITRSLAYVLPADGGNPDILTACARAVSRNFPTVQPPTLLIDSSAYPTLKQGDPLGELVSALLSTHDLDVRIDLVDMRQGGWYHTRAQAAALLGLPQAPAPDEPSNLTGVAALLCIVPPEGWYEAELDQLRSLRDAGVTLAVLLTAPPLALAQAAIVEIVGKVFCLNPGDVEAINVWLARTFPGSGKLAVPVSSPTALTATLLKCRSGSGAGGRIGQSDGSDLANAPF